MERRRPPNWLADLLAWVPFLSRLLSSAARRVSGRHHVAGVAVVIDDGRVLVAQHRFRHAAWSLPGGWIKAGEDPAEGVEREVREETGLVVSATDVVACERQGVASSPLPYSAITIAFSCTTAAGREALGPLSAELLDARWIGLAEVGTYLTAFEQQAVTSALARRPG